MSLDEDIDPVPALDPRTSKHRLLECSNCHEPVASSAWSGRVVLRCGYCSFEDERELALETPEERLPPPYRDHRRSNVRPRRLTLDLSRPLAGLRVGEFRAAELRASCSRRPVIEDELADVEWERMWMATWLALVLVTRGDTLRARVALETTLEATRTPAYRGLLLAHLAQHAAFCGATALAKKWLRACPDLAIAEVTSEMKAARAMIAWVKGRTEEVRDMTGGLCPGAGFAGGSEALAVALNLAAHDRIGDRRVFEAVLKDATRRNLLDLCWNHLTAFRLELPSVVRLVQRGRLRDAGWTFVTMAGLVLAAGAFVHHAPLRLTAIVAAVTSGTAAALMWRTSSWRATRGRLQFLRSITGVGIYLLCAMGAKIWLSQQAPLAAPTATASAAPAHENSVAPAVTDTSAADNLRQAPDQERRPSVESHPGRLSVRELPSGATVLGEDGTNEHNGERKFEEGMHVRSSGAR